MNRGYTEVIDADLSKYFDTIPHSDLMATVAQRISEGAVLHLIRMWLKAPVMEVDKDGTKQNIGGGKGNRKGTPQQRCGLTAAGQSLPESSGQDIWERRQLQQQLGACIVRYADDIVIVCRRGVEKPVEVLRRVLERLGLTLNEMKTKNSQRLGGEVRFPGILNRDEYKQTDGQAICACPAIEDVSEGDQGPRNRPYEAREEMLPLDRIVGEVNATTRGWVGCFHFKNCSESLKHVRTHAEQRLRTHLCKRHKVRGGKAGFIKFDNRTLYERYGLYKVPTTADWTRAHALR